jgi:hypothetical protein
MKFILEENQETNLLSLKDVEENQFFVDLTGCLCQKTTDRSFVVIAHSNGQPHSDHFAGQSNNLRINRILPKVVKIEF